MKIFLKGLELLGHRLRYLKINFLLFAFFVITGCFRDDNPVSSLLDIYKSYNEENEDRYTALIEKNAINLANGFPFYILKNGTFLQKFQSEKKRYLDIETELNFGDIVFPVSPIVKRDGFFYVKTIDGVYGWICGLSGISLDYTEDKNLFYFSDFSDNYYLKTYIKAKGTIDRLSKLILIKNVVPMLLGNYRTTGWFYLEDFQLARELSEYAVKIARDEINLFYASTMFSSWRVNEFVIAQNLLADSYFKLGLLDKSEDIHTRLIRYHFWKRSDNTIIGGLNSAVKLEMVFLEKLRHISDQKIRDDIFRKVVDNVVNIGDNYSSFGLVDDNWHVTASEWLIYLLEEELNDDDFFEITKRIKGKAQSSGFKDLVEVYVALREYKTGDKVKGLEKLRAIKPDHQYSTFVNINDWLSDKMFMPNDILYQYRF